MVILTNNNKRSIINRLVRAGMSVDKATKLVINTYGGN